MARLPRTTSIAHVAAADHHTRSTFLGVSSNFPQLLELDLACIRVNPEQPRRYFDEVALQGLADSIATYGLQHPIIVREVGKGEYEIVAGERRYRAVGLLKQPTIFALITDGDPTAIALLENSQRADLTPLETSDSIVRLVAQGYTQEQVGILMGKSRPDISALVSLQNLTAEIRNELRDGRSVNKSHLVELSKLSPDEQLALWPSVKDGITIKGLRSAKQPAPERNAPKLPPFFAATRQVLKAADTLRHGDHFQITPEFREDLSKLRALLDSLLGDRT